LVTIAVHNAKVSGSSPLIATILFIYSKLTPLMGMNVIFHPFAVAQLGKILYSGRSNSGSNPFRAPSLDCILIQNKLLLVNHYFIAWGFWPIINTGTEHTYLL